MRRIGFRIALVAAVVSVGGCASSAPKDVGPTTSLHLEVNPVAPGHGFVQLGGARYPFDGVICAQGPVASDPPNATRVFGVYANFTSEGTLYAISLTRYENDPAKGNPPVTNGTATITDLALVQSQGKGEVLGLQATRYRTIRSSEWTDPRDGAAHTELIHHSGDVFEATGVFGPDNQDQQSKANREGTVKARCPSRTATSTTMAPASPESDSTTVPGGTTLPASPGSTTLPNPNVSSHSGNGTAK